MIDKTDQETAQIEKASQYAGEYLDSLGKTDLAKLTREEWLTFLECVINGFQYPVS